MLFGFFIPPNEGHQARFCREDKGSIGINDRELEAKFADFFGFSASGGRQFPVDGFAIFWTAALFRRFLPFSFSHPTTQN
jgi:hypothetical protein